MGLDNFWRKDEDTEGYVDIDGGVCGGLLSGNGDSSFRGKVYNNIVVNVTGVSLYEDRIEPETIKTMNEAIQACDHETARQYATYELGEEEWDNFKKMWNAHTKAGHYLVSWY